MHTLLTTRRGHAGTSGRLPLASPLFVLLAMGLLGTGGCQLELDPVDLDKLTGIPVCDGMTLEDLASAATISDECKAGLEAYLPQPETNFSSKLIVLGSQEEDDGSLTLFVHGADGDGDAFDAAAWEDVRVSVELLGSGRLLAEDEFSVHSVADAPTDLLSIGIVNDYSGSMSAGDLRTVANIETDLFTYVPPVYEAAVTQFSSEVVQRQPFTTDQDDLLAAVAYDEEFDQDLTALYDGMASGLDDLLTRERPLRLLIVATDGKENDSTEANHAEIVGTIRTEQVPVLMLGALFADPQELRELAGPRGVYFYTPYYDDARDQVEEYLQSLTNLVALNIAPDSRGDGPVHLGLADAEGEL